MTFPLDEVNRMRGMTDADDHAIDADIATRKQRLRQKKNEHVTIWQERLVQWKDDPENTPPDELIGYFNALIFADRAKADNFSIELAPKDKLGVLDQLETWYTEKNLSFPNPAWLERQRVKYKAQLPTDIDKPTVFPSES